MTEEEYLNLKEDLDWLLNGYLKITSNARANLVERILDLIFD